MSNAITHTTGWLGSEKASELFEALLTEVVWEQRKVFGGNVPRQDAWYHLEGKSYKFGGSKRQPVSVWPEALVSVFSLVEGWGVNSVLCNLYRDGSDSVAWHSDDEPGHEASIVSLSLGATRDFVIRQKADHKAKRTIVAGHGDLIVMGEGSQDTTEHCVPKRKNVGARINLTFRRF